MATFLTWIKSKLIPEADKAWRFFSLHVALIWAALQAAWGQLQDDYKVTVLSKFLPAQDVQFAIAALGFVALVTARLIKQND